MKYREQSTKNKEYTDKKIGRRNCLRLPKSYGSVPSSPFRGDKRGALRTSLLCRFALTFAFRAPLLRSDKRCKSSRSC